jgi:hypothetical protein
VEGKQVRCDPNRGVSLSSYVAAVTLPNRSRPPVSKLLRAPANFDAVTGAF